MCTSVISRSLTLTLCEGVATLSAGAHPCAHVATNEEIFFLKNPAKYSFNHCVEKKETIILIILHAIFIGVIFFIASDQHLTLNNLGSMYTYTCREDACIGMEWAVYRNSARWKRKEVKRESCPALGGKGGLMPCGMYDICLYVPISPICL